MSSPSAHEHPPVSPDDTTGGILAWARRDPLGAALLLLITGVLLYYFGFYKVFMNGLQSTAQWAWMGWNEENDQEHCRFILPVIGWILWTRRDDLRATPKIPSARGLVIVISGVLLFVLGARCLQPRMAIVSLPLITYGMAEYLGGRAFARIFIFPCLLMLFMVPIGGVIQGTVSLQLLASKTVGALCAFLGIKVQIIGTTINVDGHSFEVAGGCSGIRSLMAMTMLAALYVYFAVAGPVRQLIVFAGSILFALVGNIARLFTVVLVAKWWDPVIAGGLYHDYSGFVFFPIAVLAMVAFGNLLARDWSGVGDHITRTLTAPDIVARTSESSPSETSTPQSADETSTPETAEARKPGSPISYDY